VRLGVEDSSVGQILLSTAEGQEDNNIEKAVRVARDAFEIGS